MKPSFHVLCLDGGGSKGVFTIGVLNEVAATLNQPLHEFFDLVYGTSTGAIIAAAVAIGMPPTEIELLYMGLIPKIMKRFTRCGRSSALRKCLDATFGERTFLDCRTRLGVVATERREKRPVIFKTKIDLAHGLKDTFVPGFGCTLAEAVEASCSAYPFFKSRVVQTRNQGRLDLIDGGFSANNPTLLAYADALNACGGAPIKILSVGVGQYPERRPWRAVGSAGAAVFTAGLIETQFASSATCLARVAEFVTKLSNVAIVRVDDAFSDPTLAASLLEHDIERLGRLRNKGRESFGRRENEIRALLAS
jgi:uncharacterized protein